MNTDLCSSVLLTQNPCPAVKNIFTAKTRRARRKAISKTSRSSRLRGGFFGLRLGCTVFICGFILSSRLSGKKPAKISEIAGSKDQDASAADAAFFQAKQSLIRLFQSKGLDLGTNGDLSRQPEDLVGVLARAVGHAAQRPFVIDGGVLKRRNGA